LAFDRGELSLLIVIDGNKEDQFGIQRIGARNMNRILISIALIISLMGYAGALDGVEMRPGEATAEKLFNYGIGQPWVGGNPPSYGASDSIYSQYYSMYTGSAPKKHIEAPKKGEIKDKTPTTVYFSYQMQAMPHTQGAIHCGYKALQAGLSMPKFHKDQACR
jgi:hypothetical protein